LLKKPGPFETATTSPPYANFFGVFLKNFFKLYLFISMYINLEEDGLEKKYGESLMGPRKKN